ncbi:MAG: hypothetical protein ACLFVK_06770 [Dehalococcoidia bacterium]
MEEIVGSLVGVTGHTFDVVYDLFFTTERLIAVSIRHPLDKPQQLGSVWQTFLVGGKWEQRNEKIERERVAQERRCTLQSMSPDELIDAHPRNFGISYSEITSVEVRRRLFQSRLEFCVSEPLTTEQTIRFNLSRNQIPEARRIVDQVLPSKIKGK